jgi:hypothetical protein
MRLPLLRVGAALEYSFLLVPATAPASLPVRQWRSAAATRVVIHLISLTSLRPCGTADRIDIHKIASVEGTCTRRSLKSRSKEKRQETPLTCQAYHPWHMNWPAIHVQRRTFSRARSSAMKGSGLTCQALPLQRSVSARLFDLPRLPDDPALQACHLLLLPGLWDMAVGIQRLHPVVAQPYTPADPAASTSAAVSDLRLLAKPACLVTRQRALRLRQ